MKHSILLASALFVAVSAQATVRTVSNAASQPAQYNDLQTAINAAVTGDTLYVLGTGNAYPAVTIDKQLTVIGSGYAPPAPAQPTTIPTLYLYPNSGGSRLIGLSISSNLYLYSSNCTVERCNIYYISTQVTSLSNLVFRHNYIYYYSMNNPASALVANNIIHSGGYLQSSNSTSVVITNNLFIGYYWHALHTISGALISNNIFWQSTPVQPSVTGCTFNNNITYQTADNVIPYGSNGGSGNQVGADPQFTNAPNITVNYAYNYDLLPASAGNNAGTDNTDIGIFGGPAPWPNQNGLARIPFVKEFNLQFTQVPQGGTVDGTVKAKKVN
ncbi:MAG: hypothetical protein IPK70_03015 [Flavobacteriales bacterium]|jgi:hypothetical protein|nr:hypothetical protein [Flavobacteriales bacterium]